MEKSEIKQIQLEDLLVDLQNPRYDPRTNQREAITTIAQDQGMKLVNLAEDIVEKGLNPSELPIVTPSGDEDTFVVLEGNRRITALKLLSSPSLVKGLGLPENIEKRYNSLYEQANNVLPRQISCAVLPREDANHWIFLRHTGENQGIGVVTWDGLQTHRFRGASPALQAIELVKDSDYIDIDTRSKLPKIAITNIERILGTPEARAHLGVDVKSGQLILRAPEEDAIARLSLVVSDVAHRLIRVGNLDTKEQRVEYAEKIAQRPIPQPISKSSTNNSSGQSGASTVGSQHSSGSKRISPDRKTLIPGRLKITIPQPRINKIYHELQKLNIEQYVNCCAVMFRVFVELSTEDFAQRHNISLKIIQKPKNPSSPTPPPRDMSLREKLSEVANYLETQSICTKIELRGIRALIANREHVLSVDSLNAYVHNKDYTPTPIDLKTTWDNLQVFVERIWTV